VFNQSLNNWKVGNVKNMYGVFQNAVAFNQSLNSWDVSGVTDFNQMFRAANAFNNGSEPLIWNTKSARNMFAMFYGASAFNNGETYNENIAGTKPLQWNTQSAVDMNSMFREARNFNQELIGWDVRNVTNFGEMFRANFVFNNGQPYYKTDNKPLYWTFSTSNNIALGSMFYQTPFSQDISSWNITKFNGMANMFTQEPNECGMTSTLCDRLLIAWSKQTPRNSIGLGTNTGFNDIIYTSDPSAVAAFNTLSTTWGIGGCAGPIIYNPISVNYGQRFTLNYSVPGRTPAANRTYNLVNNNNPTTVISSFTTTSSPDSSYVFQNVTLTDYNYSTLLIIDTNLKNIVDILYINTIFPCFKEGTKILTDKGYIPIEDLRKGDMVKTHIHGYKPIHMIGKRVIYNHARSEREKHQLYKCTSEHFPEVFEDLVITGCHSILVSDFTGPEQREKSFQVNGDIFITDDKYRLPACADERVLIYEKVGPTLIYHLSLENDNNSYNYGVYANGLLVETCSKRYLNELSHMDSVE
jgi:hypothetical protein